MYSKICKLHHFIINLGMNLGSYQIRNLKMAYNINNNGLV